MPSVGIFWDPTGTSVDTLGADEFLSATDDVPRIVFSTLGKRIYKETRQRQKGGIKPALVV